MRLRLQELWKYMMQDLKLLWNIYLSVMQPFFFFLEVFTFEMYNLAMSNFQLIRL